jgi:hypothetical protein
MFTNLPDVIARYFERDADRDIESIVSLFAEDPSRHAGAPNSGRLGGPTISWGRIANCQRKGPVSGAFASSGGRI